MRVFCDSPTRQLPVNRNERLFVQIWYSMLHQYSLDSHRVPCMNPLNIVRELRELLQKSGQLSVEEDIRMCAQEALRILRNDTVIQKKFQFQCGRLLPLLENIAQDKNSGKQDKSLLQYYLKDFEYTVNVTYTDELIAELKSVIATPGSDRDIRRLTGNALSVALDTGHSLEALFSVALNILTVSQDSTQSHSSVLFEQRLNSAAKILKAPSQEYEVVFRLEGFSRFRSELRDIDPVTFSEQWCWQALPPKNEKFASAKGPVVYAGLTTMAHDKHAAMSKAKSNLGSVLDVLRFEFEPQTITINERSMVRNKEEVSDEFDEVRTYTLVPNPRINLSHDKLVKFIDQLNTILTSEHIELATRRKIESAFRYYRTGCDSIHFENKFLNWWMALEYLLRTGNGSIIRHIEHSLCSILLQLYTAKHLGSCLRALKYCDIYLSSGEQSVLGLYRLLQNESEYNRLLKKVNKYPILEANLKWLGVNLHDAESIKKFYERHKERLGWHIHRVYRMRCDIVHSARYDLNLSLLSANLEYYLKSVLEYILLQFSKHKTLNSMDELLTRAESLTERVDSELNNGELKSFEYLLTDVTI